MTDEVYQCFRAILESSTQGKPEAAVHWECRFKRRVKRCNDICLEQLPQISPHMCRHTCCSNMAREGIDPKTLQYLMDHSDITVTMNTYLRLGLDDAQQEKIRHQEWVSARKEIE